MEAATAVFSTAPSGSRASTGVTLTSQPAVSTARAMASSAKPSPWGASISSISGYVCDATEAVAASRRSGRLVASSTDTLGRGASSPAAANTWRARARSEWVRSASRRMAMLSASRPWASSPPIRSPSDMRANKSWPSRGRSSPSSPAMWITAPVAAAAASAAARWAGSVMGATSAAGTGTASAGFQPMGLTTVGSNAGTDICGSADASTTTAALP